MEITLPVVGLLILFSIVFTILNGILPKEIGFLQVVIRSAVVTAIVAVIIVIAGYFSICIAGIIFVAIGAAMK